MLTDIQIWIKIACTLRDEDVTGFFRGRRGGRCDASGPWTHDHSSSFGDPRSVSRHRNTHQSPQKCKQEGTFHIHYAASLVCRKKESRIQKSNDTIATSQYLRIELPNAYVPSQHLERLGSWGTNSSKEPPGKATERRYTQTSEQRNAY